MSESVPGDGALQPHRRPARALRVSGTNASAWRDIRLVAARGIILPRNLHFVILHRLPSWVIRLRLNALR